MAEPLKAMYNRSFLQQFAAIVRTEMPAFEENRFIRLVTADGWDQLELKGRIRRITETLGALLPPSYEDALDVLFAIEEQCCGFPYLFFPDFVEVYGLSDWERSMAALERFTVRSTAEFAIRPFIVRDTARTIARMLAWTEHPNEHIRRLASEGCRPRLPWAPALAMFKHDPAPVLPVLEKLKRDPSLYVRKSVANNLNDIAKDHPAIVLSIALRWKGEHPWTDWIVRRGCRSLVKAADPQALAIFGYSEEAAAGNLVKEAVLSPQRAEAAIGGTSDLAYSLRMDGEGSGPVRLRIELGVDYVKSRGTTSQKRFLLADRTVQPGTEINGVKHLDWKDLSTRKHYPGMHKLHLIVNGAPAAEAFVALKGGTAGGHEAEGGDKA